jgi:hypothetical protein
MEKGILFKAILFLPGSLKNKKKARGQPLIEKFEQWMAGIILALFIDSIRSCAII